MSSIIFEGNTYTFGATVSANPGTGTVNYSLSGLASGSTYGFIVWAYNGLGPSSIVGPISALTKISLDDREPIVMFMWQYPGVDIPIDLTYNYITRNPTNYISPSQASPNGITTSFGSVVQFGNVGTTLDVAPWIVKTGLTAPDGSTTSMELKEKGGCGNGTFEYGIGTIEYESPYYSRPYIYSSEPGSTLYLSFWQNTSLGKTSGNQLRFLGSTFAPGFWTQLHATQIYPTRGTRTLWNPTIVYPSGNCGWVRFVFEIEGFSGFALYAMRFAATRTDFSEKSYYLWGFQFEKGSTFTQEKYNSGLSSYYPNVLASDNTFYTPKEYTLYNSGVTVWNNSEEWVGTWGACNGITYIFPTFEATAFKSVLETSDQESWTPNKILSKGITNSRPFQKLFRYLKQFPENRRSIRPQQLECGGGNILTTSSAYFGTFFNHYEDAITSSGFTSPNGDTYYYYDSDFNIIQSKTGYVGPIWPLAGISAAQRLHEEYFKAFALTGATISHMIFDWESWPYNAQLLEKTTIPLGWTAARKIVEDSRYRQSWNGVTALGTFMDSLGATLIDVTGSYFADYNFLAWKRTMSYQQAKAYELAFSPFYKYSPNGILGNYNLWADNENLRDGPIDMNGANHVGGSVIGQFGSPVLYGEIINLYLDNPSNRVSLQDSTKLVGSFSSSKNRLINSDIVNLVGFNYVHENGGASGIYPIEGITSPFGDYPVGLIKENNKTSNVHGTRLSSLYTNQTLTFTNGITNTNYVFSCYFRKPDVDDIRYVSMGFNVLPKRPGNAFARNLYSVAFDLLTGTTTSSAIAVQGLGYTSSTQYNGIESVGNSWYRCWVSESGDSTFQLENTIFALNGPTLTSVEQKYNGSGVSGFYLWGAQVETGTAPSALDRVLPGLTLVNQLSLPWISFICCLQLVRAHRRSSNIPQIPWISSVGWDGAGTNKTGTRPVIGFCDAKVGYNPKRGNTFTVQGGNSAYYYEMIRHAMLHGTKALSFWPGAIYEDVRYGVGAASEKGYLQSGDCGWYYETKRLNDTIKEVNELIGGFTMAAGNVSRPSWLAPYEYSGAPGPNGNTWWWRVTIQPGYTISIDGYTLPDAQGNIGKWVSTTGPTLAYVPITVL